MSGVRASGASLLDTRRQERQHPDQQAVQEHPEGPKVRPGPVSEPLDHLRGGILGGPAQGRCPQLLASADHGRAEVDQDGVAPVVEDDVLEFEVTV